MGYVGQSWTSCWCSQHRGTVHPSLLPSHLCRWLRLQGTLKEHHEALQLALEVAAFLQQADALLDAIHAKVLALEPQDHTAPCRVKLGGEHPILMPCVEAAMLSIFWARSSGSWGTELSVG